MIDENIELDTKEIESVESVQFTEDSNVNDFAPNCLALTIRKEYGLTIFKNVITHGYRVFLKTVFSTFMLNIFRMFL